MGNSLRHELEKKAQAQAQASMKNHSRSNGTMVQPPAPAPAPPPQQPQQQRLFAEEVLRRRHLSVSTANALENFTALERLLQRHRRVAVFLDYDGTLTPIVQDPSQAKLSQEMRRTLENLRTKFITGVISGRSLAKIQQFVQIPQLYYAGSHGFDIAGPSDSASDSGRDGDSGNAHAHGNCGRSSIQNRVAEEFLMELQQLRVFLEENIHQQSLIGAQVEDNHFSISLHYRNLVPAQFDQLVDLVQQVLSQFPRIKCNEGKKVFEFKPKIDWNKGKALVWLLQALGLEEDDDVFTIYIGDDTTDEDAFQVFDNESGRHGVGIVVTEESMHTGASFILHDTTQVCLFLNKLIAWAESDQEVREC